MQRQGLAKRLSTLTVLLPPIYLLPYLLSSFFLNLTRYHRFLYRLPRRIHSSAVLECPLMQFPGSAEACEAALVWASKLERPWHLEQVFRYNIDGGQMVRIDTLSKNLYVQTST